jgi:xylulokinase
LGWQKIIFVYYTAVSVSVTIEDVMVNPPILLGLDIGTSHIKAAALNPASGRVVKTASLPTPVDHPAEGLSQHDPEALWQASAACLRQVASHHPVLGLAISSFAEAGLPLDGHMKPLYPIIAWYDRRSQPQVQQLLETFGAERLHAISGQCASPSLGLTRWLWLRQNHPEVTAQTACWLSSADYILFRLTGERATDRTIASRTLFFDQTRLDWSAELLAYAGLTMDQLPRVLSSGSVAGQLTQQAAAETGLPAGTVCALGGHDHLCAALAAGCSKPGMVVDSSGTSQSILSLLPSFTSNKDLVRQGYPVYAWLLSGLYVIKGGLKASGSALDWLAHLLHPNGDSNYPRWDTQLAGMADRPVNTLWLPFWNGTGTPINNPSASATLLGASLHTSQEELLRGLLAGLACWLRHNLETMQTLTGYAPEKIILLGGVSRLNALNQMKADMLNRPVTVCRIPQTAAVGAALLAGLGLGIYPDASQAAASLHYRGLELAPHASRAANYDRLYQLIYRPAVDVLNQRNQRGQP